MAKSRAKKQREHLVRNGRRDPALSRGQQPDFSMHERKTPTRSERVDRQYRKYNKLKELY